MNKEESNVNPGSSDQSGVAEEELKMLGALVPEELYWKFKGTASERKEQLRDAIAHAARMYIDARED